MLIYWRISSKETSSLIKKASGSQFPVASLFTILPTKVTKTMEEKPFWTSNKTSSPKNSNLMILHFRNLNLRTKCTTKISKFLSLMEKRRACTRKTQKLSIRMHLSSIAITCSKWTTFAMIIPSSQQTLYLQNNHRFRQKTEKLAKIKSKKEASTINRVWPFKSTAVLVSFQFSRPMWSIGQGRLARIAKYRYRLVCRACKTLSMISRHNYNR